METPITDPTFDPSSFEPSLPAEPTRAELEQALAQAAEAYRPRLLAAAERILRDAGEAEDAVQDALVAGLRSLDRFRGESRLSSWLYRITVNCALMRLRSRRRRPAVAFEELPFEPADLPDAEALWADDQLAIRERLEATGASLARLSEVQRRALLLRSVQGLAVPEVARRIGRSTNAAKMLVHRARERVRSDIAEAGHEALDGRAAA